MSRKLITSSSNEIALIEHASELGATRVRKDIVYDKPEFIEFMQGVGKGVDPDIDRDFGGGFKGGAGLVGGRLEYYKNPVTGHQTIKFSVAVSGAGFAATLVFDRQKNQISHEIFGGGQLILGSKKDVLGVAWGASGTVQIGIFLDDDGVDIGVDTEISVGVLIGSIDINESYRIPVYEFETIDAEHNSFDATSKFAAMEGALGAEQWGYRDENGNLHSVVSDFDDLGYDIKRNSRKDNAGTMTTSVDVETRFRNTHAALDGVTAHFSEPTQRMFNDIPFEATFPADGFGGKNNNHNQTVPPLPVRRRNLEAEPQTNGMQGFDYSNGFDGMVLPASFHKGSSASEPTPENGLIKGLATNDIVEVLPGVGAAIDRRSKMISVHLETGTNNEQLPGMSPIPRPRPKLNPITEGYLKDMPEDGRLILAAEMVGFNGRKEADKAEAERMARFDVQRKMALDLEDVKAGKVSTVWDRYGHPKAVRDLLGEEAYQTFVDDRLEAGVIAHATAGLHLLQDAELFGIADGTTALEAPHEKLTELMTPKVLAAAAERARDILDMRRTKPSEAVLLSSDLSNRKARFDAALDANEAVDAEEMDAFLFYHEAAQKEIGIAEPAIEMIPPRWASQVAARFETPQADNGTPTDRRAREAELKQHYTELQQSFGSRTDDVIAYSLARTASNGAFRPDDGAPAGPRAQ